MRRLVIAEDNFLVREGIRRLLDDGPEFTTVAAAGDAGELLALVDEHCPDAVLTDIRMPPGPAMEGIEAALSIRRSHPTTGVVVLSQHADSPLHELSPRELDVLREMAQGRTNAAIASAG